MDNWEKLHKEIKRAKKNTTSVKLVGEKFNLAYNVSYKMIRKEYNDMRMSVYKRTHPLYPSIGAKGIRLSPKWQKTYYAFYKSTKDTYTPGSKAGRINEDEDFSASNFKWIKKSQ